MIASLVATLDKDIADLSEIVSRISCIPGVEICDSQMATHRVPVIIDSQYENLPAVFTAISPLLQSAPPALLSDLQDVLEACLRRSPIETGFFLRQVLMMTTAPGLARLVRRIFPQLPPATQANLRDLLQSQES